MTKDGDRSRSMVPCLIGKDRYKRRIIDVFKAANAAWEWHA